MLTALLTSEYYQTRVAPTPRRWEFRLPATLCRARF